MSNLYGNNNLNNHSDPMTIGNDPVVSGIINPSYSDDSEVAPHLPSPSQESLAKIESDQDMSLADYVGDVGKGAVNGLIGSFQGIGQLADSIAESVGYDLADDSWWDPYFQTRTKLASFTENAVSFATLAIPLGGALGAIGKATKLTAAAEAVMGARAAGWAGRIATDVAASALSRTDAKSSFAKMLQDNGWLRNELGDWLSYDESTDELEVRLKQTFQNTVLGIPMMAIGSGIKALWGARNAKLLSKASNEAIAEAGELTDDLVRNPQVGPAELDGVKYTKTLLDQTKRRTIQKVSQRVGQTVTESFKYVNPDDPADYVSVGAYWAGRTDLPAQEALDGAAADMMAWVTTNPGQLREAMFESVQNFVNHTKIDISDDAHNLIDIVAKSVLTPFERLDTKVAQEAAVEAAKACSLSGDEMTLFLRTGEQLASNMQTRAVITDLTARVLNASYAKKAASWIDRGISLLEQGASTEEAEQKIQQYMTITARTEAVYKKIGSAAAQVLASRKTVVGDTGIVDPIGELGVLLDRLTTRTVKTTTDTKVLADYTQRDIHEVVRKTFLTSNKDARQERFNTLLRLLQSDDQTRLLTAHAKNLRTMGDRAWQVLESTMMGSLLSSPKTLGTIGISGVLMTALKAGEKMAGGALTGNSAVAREGYDTIAGIFGQLLPFTKIAQVMEEAEVPSMWSNARKGFQLGGPVSDSTFRAEGIHGLSADSLHLSPDSSFRAAADYYGKLVGFPGKFLSATDELIKTSNINGLAYARALRELRAEGLTPSQMWQALPSRIASFYQESAKLGRKVINAVSSDNYN